MDPNCNEIYTEGIWVGAFLGFMLSSLISTLLIYISVVHLTNKSAQVLNVIFNSSAYGLAFSLVWLFNLLLAFFVQGCASNPSNSVYWCFFLGPIKSFTLLMWFFWNGMLIKLIQINLTSPGQIDFPNLNKFLNRKFHPTCVMISSAISLLPFIQHSYGYTEPYPAYNCGIIPQNPLSFIAFFITMLLPMWILALYYIFVFLKAYLLFRTIGIPMPPNNIKLMYQPLVIIITWIWPTIGLIDSLIFDQKMSTVIKALFMITQSYTIFLQSLLYLHHIYKKYPIKLCMDENEENSLLSLQYSYNNRRKNTPSDKSLST